MGVKGPSPTEIASILKLKVPALRKEGNNDNTQPKGQSDIETTSEENAIVGQEGVSERRRTWKHRAQQGSQKEGVTNPNSPSEGLTEVDNIKSTDIHYRKFKMDKESLDTPLTEASVASLKPPQGP
ncbi:hypothetical protein GH714_018529 [Hevea brasiliensis]|uniref:Uncharacterized protein n=1 Tax=Hevea brasiliensis TaxID=3981 RepID=A0A6A6M1U7_HEVBR|nr:hypothetical protein GH714_018529 [Hevea brasiliensis]